MKCKYKTRKMATVKYISYFGEKAVEKVSRYVNYSMELESIVGERLNGLNCDNFVRFLKLVESQTDGLPKLITKHVEGPTMYGYFNDECKFKTSSGNNELRSLVTRTLIAASIMNEQCGIVHNDLHQNNVIIASTSYDVEAYIFPDGEEYVFETFGTYPVIIDMDMAFTTSTTSSSTKSPKMLISTYAYRYGVCCHESDPLTDARRLLSGLLSLNDAAQEIYDLCMKNIFSHFHLTRYGWHKQGVFPDVYQIIKRHMKDKQCNVKIDSTTVDLFTSQISLPLRRIGVDRKVNSPRKCVQKLSYVDIKNILDDNVVENLTSRETTIVKRQFKDMIDTLNDVVYDEAVKFSRTMNDQIQQCRVKRVRDVARLIYKSIPPYTNLQTIKIYHVEQCKYYYITLSARDARHLNSKRMTLDDLIKMS